MSVISCSEFLDQIDDWLDGSRTAAANEHARECAHCSGVIADLSAIRASARTWDDDVAPPARVWTSLRAQLAEEGLIRDEAPARQTSAHRWFGWLDVFSVTPRPALAGAYLIALVAICALLVGPTDRQLNNSEWLERTQLSSNKINAQLDTYERDTLSSLSTSSPTVKASLHENLAIVDNYIALCEKSVHEEPESEIARDYLYQAYQQKADLLAEMSERGDDGR